MHSIVQQEGKSTSRTKLLTRTVTFSSANATLNIISMPYNTQVNYNIIQQVTHSQ